MHCLGAVTDLSSGKVNISPGGNRGNVLSVVQALGVLVCEGRIQGSSRGYKEGPHCSVPLQTVPNNHMCDKDNYLCNRYLVLIKEIADRVDIGANLCIEVFMCSDCPCGHATATCNNIISSIPSTLISQWPHSSEILLEYWRIGVLPSKSSEMMNPLALYQAVRSRLHFSQVAAWWSRSNGTKPAYVATRIIPHNADNLRNFRESPIEHTFPLAAIGDGNSVNVTVWALPRIKDVPTFICPIHQSLDLQEEENGARAVTPTKSVVSSRLDVGLVLPSLVDDRLQTPCDKSGKHHCNCEDEDGCPPSPCIKPNGERKRRRSLPCGPPDASSSSTFNNVPLMSVIETNSSNVFRDAETSFADTKQLADVEKFNTRSYASTSTFERCFKTQVKLTLEASECYDEKRYKPSSELLAAEMKSYVNNTALIGSNKFKSFVPFVESRDLGMSGILNFDATKPDSSQEKNDHPSAVSTKTNVVVNPLAEHVSFYEPNCGPSTFFKSSLCNNNNNNNNNSSDNNINNNTGSSSSSSSSTNSSSSSNSSSSCSSSSSSSSSSSNSSSNINCCSSSNNSSNSINNNNSNSNTDKSPNEKILDNLEEKSMQSPINSSHGNKDLSHLMSKLTFPKEINNKVRKEENGILDWISKVPGRVLGGASNSSHILEDGNKSTTNGFKDENQEQKQLRNSNAIKFKNCNLELSQREFDEVLAVLRTRTPTNRRCIQVKALRKREREEKLVDCNILEKTPIKNVSSTSHTSYSHCENSQSTDSVGNCILQSYKNLSSADSCHKSCNKADVLLGAILRTSRDRKGLIDISNGTNSRTVLSNDTSDDIHCNIQAALPGEDVDSLVPSMLNKKLNRLKLFFKKEQERRETLTKDLLNPKNNSLSSPTDYDRQKINFINTYKVKRKIDFTNYSTSINQVGSLCEEFVNGTTNKTQENSICRKIENGSKVDDLNDHKILTKNRFVSSVNYSTKNHYENEDKISENGQLNKKSHDESRSSFEDEVNDKNVPSTIEQERFRRSLENAASMVFHCRTGLPLTSSPAPLRRGSCCFDYDSTLNSVSSKRSALFELNTPPSPGSVSLEEKQFSESDETPKRSFSRSRPQSYSLLGNFEESALNGRLEPVSTVHGFTAEIGASGIFCPKHRKLPVTVFFYTLGDNDKVSTPYLAHINLGKKGYQVPRSGTIQVTLLNPLGTVVKMFVVLYDLSDMPPRSHTFLRQRTLRDKTLRYLIHLRFMSGKSGRIYLHTDIRIIICHKADVDTASDFASEPPKELKSYIHGPTNPKFSPRC